MELAERGNENRSLRKCLLTRCGQENIPLDRYLSHLKDKHGEPHVKKSSVLITEVFETPEYCTQADVAEGETHGLVTLECFGSIFSCFIGEYEERVVIWAAYISEPKENKTYHALVSLLPACIKNQKGELVTEKRTFMFPIGSINKSSLKEICEEEECLSISKDTLLNNFIKVTEAGQHLLYFEISIKEDDPIEEQM